MPVFSDSMEGIGMDDSAQSALESEHRKEVVMGKVATDVRALIDRAGEAKALKEKYAKEYDEIMDEIKAVGIPIGTTYGDSFQVDVTERVVQEIDTKKAFKVLGKNFMNCVKIIKAEAEKYLSKNQINDLTIVQGTTVVYSVKPRKN